jgi:hypothetical protein
MIEHYAFGRITVDGTTYRKDLKIYPDEVIGDWWRKEGHALHPEDMPELASKRPQHLIIGCGAQGVLVVPEATKQHLERLGIPFTVLRTGDAVQEYNRRVTQGESVAALLHLTC